MSRVTTATGGAKNVRRGSSILQTSPAGRESKKRIDAVMALAERCPVPLKARGVELPEPYNCGAYGCVYPAGAGRVAKVSFDLGEAELAILFARARGQHPALPQVFYVGRLPAKCGTWQGRGMQAPAPGYVILREDLADVAPFVELGGKARLDVALMGLDEIGFQGFEYQVELNLKALAAFPRALAVYKQALNFGAWATVHDLLLADTHLDNWGMRDGKQLVLRDFGLSSASAMPGPDAIPALQGLRIGRRKFVLRGLRRPAPSRK